MSFMFYETWILTKKNRWYKFFFQCSVMFCQCDPCCFDWSKFELSIIVDARLNGHTIFWICGNNCHSSIYSVTFVPDTLLWTTQWPTITVMIETRDIWLVLFEITVTLVQITSTLNAGSTRHISSRSIQHFLASIEYGNRRSTRTPDAVPHLVISLIWQLAMCGVI